MKIVIIGGSGLVGSNCLRYFSSKGDLETVGTHLTYPTKETVYYNALEPAHPKNFDIEQFNPDAIIHCGALTNVDYCETHEDESYRQTVVSTQNITDISKVNNWKLILISTDYLFDGANGPYTEDEPANPLNIYGKHKLEAENYVRAELEDYLIVRVTNIYGDEARNKNFVSRILVRVQNEEQIDLKLANDQYATPVNAWDIARACHLLLKDKKRGIYHLASADLMNRCELADKILSYFPGTAYSITPVSTSQLDQPAKRPLRSGLNPGKFANDYPDFIFTTLDDYVASKVKEDRNH